MARMSQLDEELKDWIPQIGETVTFRSEAEIKEGCNPDGFYGYKHMVEKDFEFETAGSSSRYENIIDYVSGNGISRTVVRRCWLKPTGRVQGVDPWI